MKVTFDHQAFSISHSGGVARYFVELGVALNQLEGIDASILCPINQSRFVRASKARLPLIGLDVSRIAATPDRVAKSLNHRLFRSMAAVVKPDIVHETYYSMERTAPVSARVVTTIHDTIPELLPELFLQAEEHKKVIRTVLKRADWVMCVSETTRRDLLKIYEFDPDRVSVAPLGVSLQPSKRGPVRLDRPYFLHVGARYPYKNFLRLIEAFGKAGMYRTHLLVSYSEHPFGRQEVEAMKQYGVQMGSVIHAGGDDDKMARYYAGAEALVVPSLYEGFGLPLVEAMACGCPVLSSQAGSLPEVAGDAAIYFEPYDVDAIAGAMLKIASSAQDRARLIELGQERAALFTWKRCAEATAHAYRQVIAIPKD
jgi:glycosyltransferase involved in cell wall biosynthesis